MSVPLYSWVLRMFVSLQFHDARDKATAESIVTNATPNLRTLFHFKRGEGYRLSATMDYKSYEGLLDAVSSINAQLPPNIRPFEVIAKGQDFTH